MTRDDHGASPRERHQIAVLPGDGIGREVMDPALEIVEATAGLWGFAVEWTEYPWSCAWYTEHGAMMPADGLDRLREHDAILLGAVGDPSVPDHVSLWGLLIPIRRAFEQYVNLRPARLLPGITSPLRETGSGIDILVIRENSEGEYSEVGGRHFPGTPTEMAVQESVFTRRGIERVVRFAAARAQERRGRLVSATKSNGIVHTMPFWDEVFAETAARYPTVRASTMHVDALAAAFVRRPQELDVVVASNLFGDILTDLGAAVVGSLGIAPSANLNPEGDHPSMFEPVHGSAPDIAGQGIANPIGQIWSAALMLEHLGHPSAAATVVAALEDVLQHSDVRTPDLGGTAGTKDVASAVLGALRDHRTSGTPESTPHPGGTR